MLEGGLFAWLGAVEVFVFQFDADGAGVVGAFEDSEDFAPAGVTRLRRAGAHRRRGLSRHFGSIGTHLDGEPAAIPDLGGRRSHLSAN